VSAGKPFDPGVADRPMEAARSRCHQPLNVANRAPLHVVFRDAGSASDSIKINVEQIFKLISPSTEVKTI
jgi:hypothetical protein